MRRGLEDSYKGSLDEGGRFGIIESVEILCLSERRIVL